MPLSEVTKKELKIAENRVNLGVCLIAKRLHETYRAVFSGCVVKVRSLFPNWRRKICIITSGKIDLNTEQYYLLYFRELDSRLIKVKLESVSCSEGTVECISGLAIIPLDDSKLTKFFKKSTLTHRPFTVNKEKSLDGTVCYIVDGYPGVFAVKAYDLEYLNGEYILKLPERGEQDATFKTFSELTAQGSNNLHPDGAVILKNVNNTLMAVGALAFVDDKISPVAFSQLQEIGGGGRQNISPTALIREEGENPRDTRILEPSSRQRWYNDVGIQTDVGHEGGGGRQNISPLAVADEAISATALISEEPVLVLITHSRLDYLAPLRFVGIVTLVLLGWIWWPIITLIGIICRRKNEPNGSVSQQLPEANGVNYPTQETDVHASQRPGAPEDQPPHQEAGGDKACGYKYPVQETGQVAVPIPDEHEDLDQAEVGLELRLVTRLGLGELDRTHPRNIIMEMSEDRHRRQVDANGVTAFFIPAIDCDICEYKLDVDYDDYDYCGYESLFVHMMEDKCDFLDCSFGTVTVYVLDWTGSYIRHWNLRCHRGCGVTMFGPIKPPFLLNHFMRNRDLSLKIVFHPSSCFV